MRETPAEPRGRAPGGSTSRRLIGVFRLADPKIMLASLVPLLAGAAIAHYGGASISIILLLVALGAVFGVEVGKNAINDLYDFRSGADLGVRPEERTPFSGGKRVLVEGLLTEREVVVTALLGFALALLLGLHIAVAIDVRLFVFGACAALISIAYTAPPLRLAYRGLGELAVFASYGPGIVLGSEALFERRVTSSAIWISLSLGALIANVLVVNELPDERADREAGKRTWVVRLGRRRAIGVAVALFVLAFALPILAMAIGETSRLAGLLAGIPAAVIAVRELHRAIGSAMRVRAQAATLAAYVLAGAGLVVLLWL
jgi:1,4-dihydroxy-2-naphthoate octaprenyltransferase